MAIEISLIMSTMPHVILIDLDGTLLEFDLEGFSEAFFRIWADRSHHLVSPDDLRSWLDLAGEGIESKSGILQSRREVFVDSLAELLRIEPTEALAMVLSLWNEEFHAMKKFWRKEALARSLVQWIVAEGFEIVIATGMLIPREAIELKLEWAGIPSSEFEYLLITDWENMHSYKPHPDYYIEVLEHIGRSPEECLMVGDSWEHDVVPARAAEIPVYWIADKEEERPDPSIDLVGQGDLSTFLLWFQGLEEFK